jgi:drug/metabolite transporter (DMT)-like permease
MNTKQKAYIALVITSIVWGTTWVAMKFGVKQLPALELAAIRQFIAGSLFVVFFLLRKEKMPTLKQFRQLFILSIFTFVLANGLSTWSLAFIPSGLGALIGALYPLSVVIIEYFFYNNKNITPLTVVGILLGVTGIGFVFYENAFHAHPEGYVFGLVLAVIAMLAWSYSSIMIARNKVKTNPYFGMGWQMVFGSSMMFIMSLIDGKNIPVSQIPVQGWLAIAYLIAAGSILAIIAFIYSMKHLPPPIASLYAYVNPIVAILIGTTWLDEKLTFNIVGGTIITLIGVYLVNRSFKKQAAETALADADGM